VGIRHGKSFIREWNDYTVLDDFHFVTTGMDTEKREEEEYNLLVFLEISDTFC
jgi:hypothetical protein